jgi:catechol 2,3-dioxygenase-like lactoylglutathione lyase family enzyme
MWPFRCGRASWKRTSRRTGRWAFQEVHREDVLGGDQVREVLLQVGDGPNLVQLLEPLTPESPVAKQIEKNGGRGGLAHVALRVADIQKAFDYLRRKGIQDHRQGAAQRLARHHRVLRASQDHRNRGVRLSDRGGTGGQPCLRMPTAEILNLGQDFPPVPTAVWEAAIAKDLKGADYEKKLVWRTDEGLAVRPYYRAQKRWPAWKRRLRTAPRRVSLRARQRQSVGGHRAGAFRRQRDSRR